MSQRIRYSIVMFAHNEEANIATSLESAHQQTNDGLTRLLVIANGCKDRTVEIVRGIQASPGLDHLALVELALGDKCNAWNHYLHELADDVDCHFFVDADVFFSENCFEQLARQLTVAAPTAHAVAGMPLSGRNADFYRSLVIERSCFFGNLYGLSNAFVRLVQDRNFRLPIGLNWIDSFLTKAVNTDLGFGRDNLPGRVTYLPEVGFRFQSLSPLRRRDIQLYLNRIARYELGKLQEVHLDRLPPEEWPRDMRAINERILYNFEEEAAQVSVLKRILARRRLTRLLAAH